MKYSRECNYLRLDKSYEIIIERWNSKKDEIEMKIINKLKKSSKDYLTCCMCKKNQVGILYLPCGHVITCTKCFNNTTLTCEACSMTIYEYHK